MSFFQLNCTNLRTLLVLSLLSSACLLAACTTKQPDLTEESAPAETRTSYESGDIIRTATRGSVRKDDLIDDLSGTEVIYLGEQHDRAESHEVQLEIIRSLHRGNIPFSIGFELFRENHQGLLDQWNRGEISKSTFKSRLSRSSDSSRIFDYYEKILNYARSNKIPLVALKPTKEAVDELRKNVADTGRDTVPDDRPLKPQELFLKETFENHVPTGRGYFTYIKVQQFWERRMAERIHNHLKNNGGVSTMIVLTGNFHVLYDFGVPNKLNRIDSWSQISLITVPVNQALSTILNLPDKIDPATVTPADYVWWFEQPENSNT